MLAARCPPCCRFLFLSSSTGTSSAGVPPEGSAIANGPFIPASGQVRADGMGPVPTTTSPKLVRLLSSRPLSKVPSRRSPTRSSVPTAVSPTAGTQYATDWVGIGGFALTNSAISDSLIQAGVQTQSDHNERGEASVTYDAFTETLPHPQSDPLGPRCSRGDTVTATVQEIASNKWRMTVDSCPLDIEAEAEPQGTVRRDSAWKLSTSARAYSLSMTGVVSTNNLTQLAQTSRRYF